MISPLGSFDKWCTAPAVAKIIPNCTLVVLLEAFLLCLVSPYDPAMQGLIELTCLHQTLTDPVVEARARDVQRTDHICWPPFIEQERVPRPDMGVRRSHAQLSL